MGDVLGAHRKWQRTLEAITRAPNLMANITWSIGNSLTYRRADTSVLATAQLVGHRRYQMVFAALTGAVVVEVAPQADLSPEADYDDLSDRQYFAGQGELVNIPAGGVLVVHIDEAARVLAEPIAEAVLAHVTVENN